MNSPILLSGIATVRPGQSAEISDPTRMQNPFRTGMLIDEIRMYFPTFSQFNLEFALRVGFRLGREPLTSNQGVSCACFARNLNDSVNSPVTSSSLGPFTWKLPKPLYIPAGEYLVPKVYHDPDFDTTGSQELEVMYVGRSLSADHPTPKVIHMPYVSQGPTLKRTISSSGDTVDETKESDLVNPFEEPLHVQHFVGRFFNSVGGTVGEDTTTDDSAGELTLIRAFDHRGEILVKDSTPFCHLFSFPDRMWPASTILAPKGFFIFQIERNYTGLTGATCDTAPIFTMVGHRDLPLFLGNER